MRQIRVFWTFKRHQHEHEAILNTMIIRLSSELAANFIFRSPASLYDLGSLADFETSWPSWLTDETRILCSLEYVRLTPWSVLGVEKRRRRRHIMPPPTTTAVEKDVDQDCHPLRSLSRFDYGLLAFLAVFFLGAMILVLSRAQCLKCQEDSAMPEAELWKSPTSNILWQPLIVCHPRRSLSRFKKIQRWLKLNCENHQIVYGKPELSILKVYPL